MTLCNWIGSCHNLTRHKDCLGGKKETEITVKSLLLCRMLLYHAAVGGIECHDFAYLHILFPV